MIIALVLLTALIAGLTGLVLGMAINIRTQFRKGLREAGLNKNTAKLYGRAIKILRRLEGLTDLDGAYAGDVLSPETKKLVTEWVADYRKEISK